MPRATERAPVLAQLEGAEDLVVLLRQIGAEFGPQNAATAFNTPLRNAWRPVEQYVRRETPVDVGNLRDSTALRVGRPTSKEIRSGQHVSRTTGVVARAGWFWGGRYGRRTNSHQALAVEFGTATQPAQFVLRRGFARQQDGALRTLGRETRQSLLRRSNQLSRRRARGRLRIR